ncbi:PACE efflux transporter [Vibrio barjaei]|uniref:PACE efflux transporter n=1 Tax=Vibrio barjaei TaxID=1676683 RepID=UPI0022841FF9|nr:PACE efflux transporter [Vibrio barjaei]MCY9874595.1 PACE efflux transporter [Vibrio barjaei]
MATQIRNGKDRLRHTVLFEVFLLIITTPLAKYAFHASTENALITSVSLTTIAMAWNFIFNWIYDWNLARLGKSSEKTLSMRIGHALAFEGGLIILTVPVIAYTLSLSLLDALIADIGFVIIALIYAFIFNWAYDKVFPINNSI